MASSPDDIPGLFLRGVHEAERRIDRWRLERRRRRGRMAPLTIIAYRGFGTERELVAEGRVVERRALWKARPEDTPWRNLRTTLKRFTSREMPEARIRARFRGREQEVVADEEGYFQVHIDVAGLLPQDQVWHGVELELLGVPGVQVQPVRCTAGVLVPPIESLYGIISDIDDTVLRTGVTNRLGMLRSTFLLNAHTRMPFKGVAALYRALQRGPHGTEHNPIFYVSSSPWNLYDLLTEFLDIQQIPTGPLLLRDLGMDVSRWFAVRTVQHKTEQIDRVLSTYPKLPFILIGDSGQEDPEIYLDAIQRHPGRILAAYIRDVTPSHRDAEIDQVVRKAESLGVEMLLVRDTEAAAEHAVQKGFIPPEALPDVRAEKAKDKRVRRTATRAIPRPST